MMFAIVTDSILLRPFYKRHGCCAPDRALRLLQLSSSDEDRDVLSVLGASAKEGLLNIHRIAESIFSFSCVH